jgi:hypothetical protein
MIVKISCSGFFEAVFGKLRKDGSNLAKSHFPKQVKIFVEGEAVPRR